MCVAATSPSASSPIATSSAGSLWFALGPARASPLSLARSSLAAAVAASGQGREQRAESDRGDDGRRREFRRGQAEPKSPRVDARRSQHGLAGVGSGDDAAGSGCRQVKQPCGDLGQVATGNIRRDENG